MFWLNKLLNRSIQSTEGSGGRLSHHAVCLCISITDGDQRGWWESLHPSRLQHQTKWYRQLLSHRSSAAQGLQCVTAGSDCMSDQKPWENRAWRVKSSQVKTLWLFIDSMRLKHEMKYFSFFVKHYHLSFHHYFSWNEKTRWSNTVNGV